MPDLQSARTALKSLFNAHDYSIIENDARLVSIDTFKLARFDEIHIQSSEQDCDNQSAIVTLYGLVIYGGGFMLEGRAHLTRKEAWEFGSKYCNDLIAKCIGFSCNPDGFSPDGWISMQLQLLPKSEGSGND